MAMIVYRPEEMVTLDLPAYAFQRWNITLEGHRLVAAACLGAYRARTALMELLHQSTTWTRSELIAQVKRALEADAPFTCLLQCTGKETGTPKAFQLHRPEGGLLEMSAVSPVGRAVKYASKPGVPFSTFVPAMLAEAPMCALTFAASRAVTLADMGNHNKLYLSTGRALQEFTLTEILERFDNTARMARTAI